MKQLAGEEIAARAMTQIGTPFRLHGRIPDVALDCVGLVAHTVECNKAPKNYTLKGTKLSDLLSYMDTVGLSSLCATTEICNGDIAVVACSPQQFHLMVRAADGWVHSHAGLRKVVHTPGLSPWPIVAVRRMIGD